MNESYISVKDIITLLLRHIRLIIFFSILGAVAGFCISKYVLPPKYASQITVYVQSYTDISENSASVNNINYSKQLVNTYIEVMKDDIVIDAVGEELLSQFDSAVLAENFSVNGNNKLSPSSIRNCLSISSVEDTSAIKVVSIAKNPEVASAVCNALTKVAPEYMMEAVGVGSINTIGTAKTNYRPVGPNLIKNTFVSGVAGFLLIMLIIFLIDFFDNTVKDSDTLKNQYKKAIIGEIQQFGENWQKKRSDEYRHFKLTDKDVPFEVVESFKSIRTNVTFSLSTSKRKIVAVSSARFGDGKSTTCANLAIAMAQSGNKVLLIDADMRRSVQHIIFGLKNDKGLSTAAGKMNPLDKCIQKNVMENLDVMTAGPTPPNPSELLASEQMTVILNELSSRYGVIIIDTPPVNIVTDAMELAKNDAGIIMVVRYGVTTDEDLKTAGKKIEFAEMNMLGFILNGIKDKDKQHEGCYSYSGSPQPVSVNTGNGKNAGKKHYYKK